MSKTLNRREFLTQSTLAAAAASLPSIGLTHADDEPHMICLLYTSPSPRDRQKSRMPSSA